ncbi:MAG TPA: threonine/serine exporter family protein [Candidatus Avacidaminococcus intestinavium]|uniref:Threonine/serine exporter family protein n=1 Tax=Candidatus Avacidaminococcus intestinavium TaxID=2840684 RepID=A0A9D1MPU5_9FIRM|nr:threonine/serine exporter family protein [Candidatus Avacidaminococcus intestinavium]
MSKVMAMTREEFVNIALLAGKILLTSGAETSRVEDTIVRLCEGRELKHIMVFVTPTAVIISTEAPEAFTCMTTVKNRNINLSHISAISDMSYAFSEWPYDYVETKTFLEDLLHENDTSAFKASLASGIGSGCFATMLGGSVFDFIAAFVASFGARIILQTLALHRISTFWENAVAGIIIAGLAVAVCSWSSVFDQENIIVGGIMPFLPGVALTNALRDFMAGDLLSGNARLAEAFLFAASLALGIAVVLRLFLL